jgi:hypothetical protein
MLRHPVTKNFTTLQYTSPRWTSLHYNCQHFTSSLLNFTQLHFTTLSFGLTPFKFHTAPFHLTSLHCICRRFSPHFYSFHFTTFLIAFLTLFLKILGLKGNVPNAFTGRWFKFLMVLFTKDYFPISYFVSCPKFSEHDQHYSNSKAFVNCPV